jgi:hypothetical protein
MNIHFNEANENTLLLDKIIFLLNSINISTQVNPTNNPNNSNVNLFKVNNNNNPTNNNNNPKPNEPTTSK